MTLVAATTETIDAMCYDSVRGWTAKYEDHSRVKLSAYTVPEDARGPTTWRGRSRSLSWRLSSEEGVKIFDPERKTALCTDYSTTGVGYFLYQKWCSCKSDVTMCYLTGWRVTLAGSRFLHKAEANYWPTEGEMLAVAWAPHDSRFFTIGCRDLHIQTDHRALVKLLGDKRLEDIDNRRLVNLMEKTMAWNFSITWVPGTAIPGPDATSRQSQASTGEDDDFTVAVAALQIEEDEIRDLAGDMEFAAYGRGDQGGYMGAGTG